MSATAREYDVVLYGAGGFTGKQTVCFAKHAPAGMRWAIAGEIAVEAVRAEAGGPARAEDVLVATAGMAPPWTRSCLERGSCSAPRDHSRSTARR
jgi:short subunit dehydrogenase-like uncharacterized protein